MYIYMLYIYAMYMLLRHPLRCTLLRLGCLTCLTVDASLSMEKALYTIVKHIHTRLRPFRTIRQNPTTSPSYPFREFPSLHVVPPPPCVLHAPVHTARHLRIRLRNHIEQTGVALSQEVWVLRQPDKNG
jgi:hypothetical protein